MPDQPLNAQVVRSFLAEANDRASQHAFKRQIDQFYDTKADYYQDMLRLRYGVHSEAQTFAEIAMRYHFTPAYIRQVVNAQERMIRLSMVVQQTSSASTPADTARQPRTNRR